jgi:hypothetical protein
MGRDGHRWFGAATAVALVLVVTSCDAPVEVVRSVDDGAQATSPVDKVTTGSPETGGRTAQRLESLGLSIPRDCPVPWEPVYAGTEYTYPSTVPAFEARPERGDSLDVLTRRFDPPDTDGDGTPDIVGDTATSGETVVITRTDGDLVLASDRGVVGTSGGMTAIGDLDGDGRDEVLVFSSADGPVDGGYRLYVVPGSTPSGRHDPAVVGVRLPGSTGTPLLPAGDQDGDGTDDVIVWAGDSARVVGGASLMAPGPGGALDDPAAIPGTPDGWVIGVVQLAPDHPPVLVLLTDGPDGAAALELWTEPRVVLGTRRAPLSLDSARGMAPVTAYWSGENRVIELASQMDRSGATTAWAWSLDDPCAGPTSAD